MRGHLRYAKPKTNRSTSCKYYNVDLHMLDFEQPEQYVVWDLIEIDQSTQKMEDDFRHIGLGHTFSIIRNKGQYVDCYHFAAKRGLTSINQRYLENLDLQ